MSTEEIVPADGDVQRTAVASSIPKFCPVDGDILYRQYVPELECDCWLCPTCEYIEPIL